MTLVWPMVGRAAELGRLRDLLVARQHSGVVLVGPAGVGKTRLARECLDVGERAGYATALAVASRSAVGIPLGALAPLLPSIPTASHSGFGLLKFAQDGLARLAGDRPLLLVVDDAHDLDDASAVLLRQLAETGAAFVVATVRSGEPTPDPVAALWKDGLAERIELGSLGAEPTQELLEAVLGGPLEAVAARQLWAASRGNVLYLRELVLSGLDTHTLVDDAGLWRLVGEVSPSSRLRDLVETRLARLDDDEVTALELVAFGEPLDLDAIDRLGATAAVERLERKAIVAIREDGEVAEVRLAHPLHGEVLRERTPVIRSRRARRSLADAVEAVGADRAGDVLRVALWRLDGGGAVEPEALLEGATLAAHAFDYATAERLARAAFDAAPSFAAGYVLAGAVNERGDHDGVDAVLSSLSDLAETDDDLAGILGLRVANLFWRLRDLDQAIAVGEAGIAALTGTEARDYVSGQVAVLEACAGRPGDAVARVGHLFGAGGGRAFCHAAFAGGLALPMLGRADEGADLARRGIEAYADLGVQGRIFEVSMLGVIEVLAMVESGRTAAARALAVAGFDRSVSDQDDAGRSLFAIALGVIDLETGAAAASVRRWREAEARFRAVRHDGMTRWALGGLLFAQALMRDLEGARATVAALDGIGEHPATFADTIILRARAWLLAAEHDRAGAVALLSQAAAQAGGAGLVARELPALEDLARLGSADHALARAREIAASMGGALPAARLAHIEALASGRPEALTAASEALAACGAIVVAAEAMIAASEAYRRDGDARRAGACARRGRELADACPGVVTPGLAQADAVVPLTRREREIALLGAEGLSSRAIADRLVLSIRTVDNHLARIYDKLGLSGRAELAEAMKRPGVP